MNLLPFKKRKKEKVPSNQYKVLCALYVALLKSFDFFENKYFRGKLMTILFYF